MLIICCVCFSEGGWCYFKDMNAGGSLLEQTTTGSQDGSGWKRPQEVSGPKSCSQQGQACQTRLLRASSTLKLAEKVLQRGP